MFLWFSYALLLSLSVDSHRKGLSMKQYLFFACLCCTLISQAQNSQILHRLDDALAQESVFHQAKQQQLDSLRRRIPLTRTPQALFDLYTHLYDSYQNYQADSALHYLDRAAALLPKMDSPRHNEQITIHKAKMMGVMGMYHEALNLLSTLSSQRIAKENLENYYQTYRANYGWLADYTTHPTEREKYLKCTDSYRDSILLVTPSGVNRLIVEAEQAIVNGHPEAALNLLRLTQDSTLTLRQKAYIYYTTAQAYEAMQQTYEQIQCLALTAIADIQGSVREYASLQKLAVLVYRQGDIGRAYRYLTRSMQDAVACNARLRFIEVTQFFPIIDQAYKLKAQKARTLNRIFFISVSLLSLVLLVSVFYLYRSLRKLSLLRRNLSVANEQLQAVNLRLVETGKIKETYIAHYLDRCVNYLNQLETYRRSLVKLAMSSRIDDLFKAIKSEQFIRDERKAFYRNFDESFLKLFPHFIDSFNALLQPDARIVPKNDELLTTELRIFALIRLGVTDSQRIAYFLDYSLATIYNYRSRMRGKAQGDKDRFEQDVMAI